MASNAKNIAEMLNTDVTVTATDIADGAVTTAKLADDAVTPAKSSKQLFRKNLLDNGAMSVWQRGGSTTARAATGSPASVTINTGWSSDDYGGPDRWRTRINSAATGEIRIDRTPDVPAGTGFPYSCKLQVTTAYNVNSSTSKYAILEQRLPLIDIIQATNWSNSSSGNDLTFSFWMKSSITGTYSTGVYIPASVLVNNENCYVTRSFTIDTANTWEKKTITIPANTTSSSVTMDFDKDDVADALASNSYMLVWIWLDGTSATYGANSLSAATLDADDWRGSTTDGSDFISSEQVNWLNNLNATAYFTGLQLEVGSEASEFEYRPIQDEYATCQKYYNSWQHQTGLTGNSNPNNRWYGTQYNTNGSFIQVPYPQLMIDEPTIIAYASTAAGESNGYHNPSAFVLYDSDDASVYVYGYQASADY